MQRLSEARLPIPGEEAPRGVKTKAWRMDPQALGIVKTACDLTLKRQASNGQAC